MDIDDQENSLVEDLSVFGISVKAPYITERFRELQNRYGLDDDSLLEKYIAFRSNKKLGNVVELQHLDAFEKENLSKRQSAAAKDHVDHKPVNAANASFLTDDMVEDMQTGEAVREESGLLESYNGGDVSFVATPRKRPSVAPDVQPSSKQRLPNGDAKEMTETFSQPDSDKTPSSRRFAARTNAGEVVCSFGELVLEGPWCRPDAEGESEFLIRLFENKEAAAMMENQQYMYEKLVDRADLLESLIEERTRLIKTANDISEELSPVGMLSQESCVMGGRVTSDFTQGKLSALSVVLEGGRDSSAGRCVALNLAELAAKGAAGFSLFPGQVVLCEGVNPSGKQLLVRRLLDSAPLPEQPLVAAGTQPLFVVAACGPFTTTDNNRPDPLRDLLRSVKTHRPHLLVLFGPLVDAQHPLIPAFREQTYEELFQSRLNSVAEWCAHLNIPLVVVPSAREAHHHPVFPQFPYSVNLPNTKMQQMYKHVHLVPDPCVLRVGPYVLGLTATDILMGLSAEEVSANRSGQDRMARLCAHLLQQRSFYPLQPPAEDVPADLSLWGAAALPVRPHLLLTPSQLRHFVKDVSDVLCVNPGRLTRGEAGGTFARIVLAPDGAAKSKVDVVRI